jgi:hypothetical protein
VSSVGKIRSNKTTSEGRSGRVWSTLASCLDFKNPLKPTNRFHSKGHPIIADDWPMASGSGRFLVGYRQPLKMLGALNLASPTPEDFWNSHDHGQRIRWPYRKCSKDLHSDPEVISNCISASPSLCDLDDFLSLSLNNAMPTNADADKSVIHACTMIPLRDQIHITSCRSSSSKTLGRWVRSVHGRKARLPPRLESPPW